jgi:hypothetical protein
MTNKPDQNSQETLRKIENGKEFIVDCLDNMNVIGENEYLEGADARNWVRKFAVIRKNLDDCEDILDALNEKHMETCGVYKDLIHIHKGDA